MNEYLTNGLEWLQCGEHNTGFKNCLITHLTKT